MASSTAATSSADLRACASVTGAAPTCATLPAVTHVDYSARVQTVRREESPAFYDLLAAFERLTGCAVLVNTSFNVRGEPIVCTPEQAYTCFMRTEMDCLVLGDFVLEKAAQGPSAFAGDAAWQEEYQLD